MAIAKGNVINSVGVQNKIDKLIDMTKSREIVKKIAFTGMMLGIIFILSYLETFATLGWGFLQVNFSLIFVLGTLFYSGKDQTLILMVSKLFLVPLLIPRNAYVIELTNCFILFIQETLFIVFVLLLSRIKKLPTPAIILSSLMIASIIIPWIRASFLQPLYYYAWGMTKTFTLQGSMDIYNTAFARPFYFYIHNYWIGNFVIFFLSNLIRFSIAIIIIFPLIKIIELRGNNGWTKINNKAEQK